MKSQYVIIIGCGRLGAALANRLSRLGHSIVTIDHNEDAFSELGNEYSGFKIHGDANEFFTLRQAKVENADLVLALTDDDNLNIMLSQICQKIYHISGVIARVNNPKSAQLFSALGIKTICPTQLAEEYLLGILDGDFGAGGKK